MQDFWIKYSKRFQENQKFTVLYQVLLRLNLHYFLQQSALKIGNEMIYQSHKILQLPTNSFSIRITAIKANRIEVTQSLSTKKHSILSFRQDCRWIFLLNFWSSWLPKDYDAIGFQVHIGETGKENVRKSKIKSNINGASRCAYHFNSADGIVKVCIFFYLT